MTRDADVPSELHVTNQTPLSSLQRLKRRLGALSSLACGLAVAAILGACGGNSSTPVAATATSTVSGTAATGVAIAAGTVTLKCVSGTTGVVTTGTDGSFSINVAGVTLPCIGRVDYSNTAGAQKLHTYISAIGNANITPVTELIVAHLLGGTAIDAFDKFDAAKVQALTAARVQTAIAAVKSYVTTTLGVDGTNIPAETGITGAGMVGTGRFAIGASDTATTGITG